MSDLISLDWIGGQLRSILAEQRTIRAENEIFRSTILNALKEVVRVLNDRIGKFEAVMEARFDRLVSLLEPSLTQHGLQLVEQGAGLARQGVRLDGLGAEVARQGTRLDEVGAQLNRIEALPGPAGHR
jgi:hypothetical protein